MKKRQWKSCRDLLHGGGVYEGRHAAHVGSGVDAGHGRRQQVEGQLRPHAQGRQGAGVHHGEAGDPWCIPVTCPGSRSRCVSLLGVTRELPLVRTAPVLTFNCWCAGGGRALRRGCAGQRENLRVRRTGRCCSPAAASTNTRPGSEEEAYTGTHRGAPDTAEALAHKSAFSADGTYCPSNEFKWKYNFVWSSLSVPGGRAGLGCHAWGAGGQLAVTTGQCRHSTLGAGPSQGRTKVSGVTRPRPLPRPCSF